MSDLIKGFVSNILTISLSLLLGQTIFKNVFFSLVYVQEMSYTHATLLGVSENQGRRNVKHFDGDMLISGVLIIWPHPPIVIGLTNLPNYGEDQSSRPHMFPAALLSK